MSLAITRRDNFTSASVAKVDEDAVDVMRILALLRSRWRTIFGVAAFTFLAVVAATLVSPMTFSATGRLYLGELTTSPAPASEEVELSTGMHGDVSSEVEILTSRSLVSKAVATSGLNVQLRFLGERPTRYWDWRLSKRDPNLLDAAVRRLRATQSGFKTRTRDSKTYRISFLDGDQYEVRGLTTDAVLATGKLGEPISFENVDLHLVAGKEEKPAPGETYEATVVPVPAAVESTLASLTVAATKAGAGAQPNVINLSYIDQSPLMAAEFLTALMAAYLHERQEWKTEDASAAEAFVSEQLKAMRASLDKAQADLAAYRSNNRVVVLDNEAEAMIAQISRYEEQRVAARLEAEALSDVKVALSSGNPAPEAFMLGEARDTVLSEMAHSLSQSKRDLAELETRFSSEAPDVINKKAQVESQLATIRSYVSNRLKRAQENLGTLSGVIGTYENKLKTVPEAELGLAQLTREAEVYDSLYAFLLRRQQQAAITKASTVSKNRVLDHPEVAFWEDSPKLGLRLMSAPLGLVLGVLVVLVGSFFSRYFQSSAEVYSSLGGVPVLATVPRAFARSRKNRLELPPNGAMLEHQVTFGFVEACRTLRTNLYLAAPSAPGEGKVVLVTSPSPGDGKSTCALALAWILAADGKRVMIVDADLRKPSHIVLTEPGKGAGGDLIDVLNGECSWQDAARPIKGSNNRIHLLCLERTAPAEVFSGQHIRPFLNALRSDLDYVIVDSASFPLVSDALIVAPAADVTISVLRPGNTPRRIALEHVRQILGSSNVYGVLVNDASEDWVYGETYPKVA